MSANTMTSHWQALPNTYRALVVRNGVDRLLIAVDTQHERMMQAAPWPGTSLLDLPMEQVLRGSNDLDFFLITIRRLRRTAVLSRSCDSTGALREPIKLFEKRIAGVTVIRDAIEHSDDFLRSGRGIGLGIGMNEGSWWITYGDDVSLQTGELVTAAHDIHREIRAVVDEEAALDPHATVPTIDLSATSGAGT